jgi:hypothetical protein
MKSYHWRKRPFVFLQWITETAFVGYLRLRVDQKRRFIPHEEHALQKQIRHSCLQTIGVYCENVIKKIIELSSFWVANSRPDTYNINCSFPRLQKPTTAP